VNFSPESLLNAARVAHGLLETLDTWDYDNLPVPGACTDPDCADDTCQGHSSTSDFDADDLEAELLRDLRPGAPAYLARIAAGIVESWIGNVSIEEGASVESMLESVQNIIAEAAYRHGSLDRGEVRDGLTLVWDGKAPRQAVADPWGAVRARVSEQLDEELPPLLAKTELFAKLFALRTEPGEAVALEALHEVLHNEYGLPRPETEAEPRSRARP